MVKHSAAAAERPDVEGPELTWLDAGRTYAVGVGTSARPGWSRQRVNHGTREIDHITVGRADDPPPPGPAPSMPIPDHFHTVIRDDTALLPVP